MRKEEPEEQEEDSALFELLLFPLLLSAEEVFRKVRRRDWSSVRWACRVWRETGMEAEDGEDTGGGLRGADDAIVWGGGVGVGKFREYDEEGGRRIVDRHDARQAGYSVCTTEM